MCSVSWLSACCPWVCLCNAEDQGDYHLGQLCRLPTTHKSGIHKSLWLFMGRENFGPEPYILKAPLFERFTGPPQLQQPGILLCGDCIFSPGWVRPVPRNSFVGYCFLCLLRRPTQRRMSQCGLRIPAVSHLHLLLPLLLRRLSPCSPNSLSATHPLKSSHSNRWESHFPFKCISSSPQPLLLFLSYGHILLIAVIPVKSVFPYHETINLVILAIYLCSPSGIA